jgi:hypothetical protein
MNDPVKRAAYIARLTEEEKVTKRRGKADGSLGAVVGEATSLRLPAQTGDADTLERRAHSHGYRWECSKCQKLFKRKSSPRGPWSLHLSKAEQERVALVLPEQLLVTAIHESAHALVAYVLGRRFHKQLAISVIPKDSFLGRFLGHVRGAGNSLCFDDITCAATTRLTP